MLFKEGERRAKIGDAARNDCLVGRCLLELKDASILLLSRWQRECCQLKNILLIVTLALGVLARWISLRGAELGDVELVAPGAHHLKAVFIEHVEVVGGLVVISIIDNRVESIVMPDRQFAEFIEMAFVTDFVDLVGNGR